MLEKSEYYNETLNNLVLNSHKFSAIEFNTCIFEKCNFEKSVFKSCKFIDCIFNGCNLSLVKVPNSSFIDTKFKDSKVIGVNWTEASQKLFSLAFLGSIINFSSFQNLNIQKFIITDCKAHEVDFSNANMTLSVCKSTDFTSSRFNNTNMTKADFTDARNYSINPLNNILTKARFSLPEAISLLSYLGIEIT